MNWNTRVRVNRFVAGDLFKAADIYIGSHIGWSSASRA